MENHQFDTDINQLLSLIIHSIYSQKEVFLRELISNASDAIEKHRLLCLSNEQFVNTSEYYIKIKQDVENKLLIIEDNGIGMTKSELVENLGTIARSGTKRFLESLKSKETSVNQIGQFGVGFYSSFLVSDLVRVQSSQNGESYIWESDGTNNFKIYLSEDQTLERGTRLYLHLKDDSSEFLEQSTIKTLVDKHSKFIVFPIHLWTSKEVEKQLETVTDSIAESVDESQNDEVEIEDVPENETKPETEPKTVKETVWDFEHLNNKQPLWMEDPKNVTKEQYTEFYKAISDAYDDPVAWKHFKAEGQLEYRGLVYLPSRPPYNFMPNESKKNVMKLYVKRVFIMDNCEDLLPEYLRFIRGVVDSEDLPLNVSREMLQNNKTLKVIKKNFTKKVIETMEELMEDEEKYENFYKSFS
jgi:molecular chaperone HtpG